jgi:putative acetyltransferase
MAGSADLEIVTVACAEQLGELRALFEEYWDSFGFTPCFQNFRTELAALPGRYAPPQGRLALALVGGDPAGCVALRPIDAIRCEAKRLYVKPPYLANVRRHGQCSVVC